ncbi:MAG: glycoside hydrolase family 97 protein [Ignavibacteriales bacterium]|nr:glycoside hydrolase family 97 protein [Ignavibacteriales bacterium]
MAHVKSRANSFLFAIFIFSASVAGVAQDKIYQVKSPDGKSELRLTVANKLAISVFHNRQEIISPSLIEMHIDEKHMFDDWPVVLSASPKSVESSIVPIIPEKRNLIPDIYNELTITFKGDYGLRLRAYDDGVAYRFFTTMKGEITVFGEELNIILASSDSIWFPEETSFLSHSERLYRLLAVKDLADTQMCCIPAVIVKSNGPKVAFTEADLLDYPGLYLRGSGAGRPVLRSKFPPFPLEEQLVGDRTMKVSKAANYIAKTNGVREFPWRVFAIANKDGDLIENDIVYRLGSPLKLKETSWIKPGKVAWDWWNANNLIGVPFKAGINTETYKHYIEFASRYGLEYVIFDEGWSKPSDLFQINPDMNMDELFTFAAQKKVGIILWVTSKALDDRMTEALDRFEKWGSKGVKVDFMQRDDQKMVNWYEKVAIEAAKRHLLVDFHGAYKPTGFSRTYPHVLTREGVQGLEHSKWSADITPKHDVTLPFTRMFAGPMDFTPGAMINATKESFRPIFTQPMSQGTRCHQLAMYVVYESPLQMLCDSPTNYDRQPDAMEFLSVVPTTWDQTRTLNARIGEYLTVARKKGNDWFIGSMTNWTPRDLRLSLDFLDGGKYQMIFYCDGINADRNASDYRKETNQVDRSSQVALHLAPGGGWAAYIKKID